MHSIDVFVQQYFSLWRTLGVTEFVYLVTILFDFSIHFVLLLLCVAALVYLVRGVHYSTLLLLSIIFGALSVYVLKLFFNVARPLDGVMVAFGKSFPSGHATVATIFFVMLMYIFDGYFRKVPRILFNIVCTGLIFLVAFSRVYLGVHWVSDVAFGILLGCVVSFLSIFVFQRVSTSTSVMNVR